MAMLNYLGANPAPGLTMPGGMPGSGGPADPMSSPAAAAPSPMGPPPPDMGGGMGGGMGPMGFPSVGMTDPAGRQYDAVTQDDGSVLLHMKNPDGSRGPAVKIIPPIKSRKPGM
jgi:hypothetical protein